MRRDHGLTRSEDVVREMNRLACWMI